MATPRIEQIQRALQRAQAAGDNAAVQEIQALLDRESAYEALRVSEQTPSTADPINQQEIDRRMQIASREGLAARDVGLGTIAGQSLAAEAEALPSGVSAGAQLGGAEYLREGRERSWADTRPGLMSAAGLGGLEAASQLTQNIAGRVGGMFGAEESLREGGAESLQETLDIRQRNALEAQRLRERYLQQGGSEFAGDLAGAVGGSASSFLPQLGAVATGLATRSPAAALAVQRGLATVPAAQAYASAYAEFKQQYPNASEEEAQRYAATMAGSEYIFEAIPGGVGALRGTGVGTAIGEVAKRTGREAIFEAGTEGVQQLIQRGMTPELAPQTGEEAAYNIGLAAATAGLISGPINTVGVAGERAQLTRAERVAQQQRMAEELRQVSPPVAEGFQEAARIEAAVRGKEVPPPAVEPAPTPEPPAPVETPEAQAFTPEEYQTRIDSLLQQDQEVRSKIAEIESNPSGPTGQLSRKQRAEVRTLREQTSQIGMQVEVARRGLEEAKAPTRAPEPVQEVTATTVAPQPQTVRSEAPRPPSVESQPLSRGERTALANLGYDGPEIRSLNPSVARELITNQSRKDSFGVFNVDEEGNILSDAGRAGGRQAISPTDTAARAELFDIRPPGEQKLASPEEASALQDPSPTARVVPPERRAPTPVEDMLREARTAEDALRAISQRVPQESPYRRVMDTMLQSPFLKDTDFRIVQPEDAVDGFVKGKLDRPNLRGFLNRQPNQRNTVFVKGSGFEVNGVRDVEASVHEIVHGVTSDLIDGVNRGRVTSPDAVSAVKDLEKLRLLMETNMRNDPAIRQAMSGPERSAVDYSLKNTDEFVAVALSSPGFQVAMKREGIWDKFVNLLRKLFKIPRADKSAFEQILDAGLSVVEAQTRNEQEVRTSRAETDRRIIESRQARLQSPEMAMESASPVPVDIARQKPLKGLRALVSRALTGPQAQVIKRAAEIQQGIVSAEDYVGVSMTNLIRRRLERLPESRKKIIDEAALKYLRGEAKPDDIIKLSDEMREALQQLRQRWDANTDQIIREFEVAFDGKPIPKEYEDKIKTLKSQKGRYLTRIYQQFTDPKYSERTWNEYEKGKANPDKRDTDGYRRVSNFVEALGKTISNLPQKLDKYRQDAQALGEDFEPWEMATRAELKDYYESLVGNSNGVSVKDMFEALEPKAQEIAKGSANDTAEIIAKVLLDPEQGDTAQGSLYRFYRNLATDDAGLRKRTNINALVRNLWGEAEGVVAIAMATSARQGSVLAGLKSLNDVAQKAPNLFSETPSLEQTKQIPNNPQRYGALAGLYTDPVTHDGIVQFGAVMDHNLPLKVYGYLAGKQKKFNTVYNPRAYIQELLGGPVIMLANGVPPTTKTIKNVKDAINAAGGLVGTVYRADPNKLSERMLKLGLIEPVVTGGIQREARQVQLEDSPRSLPRTIWEDFTGSIRELKEAIEVYPGLTVFLDEMQFQLSRREGLAEAYKKAEAKDPADRTREDRAVIKEMEDLEEQVANRTKHTTFAFSRAPNFAKVTERYGLSSFAVYLADTFRVLGNSYRYGYAEMMEGRRTGDTELTMRGARKMTGAMLASIATPAVVSAGLAADIKVLGAFAGFAMAGALGGEDDEEVAEMMAKLQEAQPFSDQSKSTIYTKVDEDMNVHYTDAGRWESLDPSTGALRGSLIGMYEAIAKGDTDMLADTATAVKDQFFGGSMLVDSATQIYKAIKGRDEGKPRVIPSTERKAPETMSDLYAFVDRWTPVSFEDARVAAVAVEDALPAILRNVPAAIETARNEEGGAAFTSALLGGFSQKWNVKDDLQGFAGQQYVSEIRNARTKELAALMLRPREVSEEVLYNAYADVASRELAALDEVKKKVEAYRVVNQQLGRRPDDGLRETLKSARMSNDEIDMAMGIKPFTPRPIDNNFFKSQSEQEARRVTGVTQATQQDLPEMTRERRAVLQQARLRWIEENLNN